MEITKLVIQFQTVQPIRRFAMTHSVKANVAWWINPRVARLVRGELVKANRDEEAVPILLCPRRTSSQFADGVRRVERRDESSLRKFLHLPDRFGG